MHWTLLSLLSLLTGCNNYEVGSYNTAPSAAITSPPDRSEFLEGETILFEGLVKDDFDPPTALAIQWSSDVDGVLLEDDEADSAGQVFFETANLSPANHTIILRARDTEGEPVESSVRVTVIELPDAPTMEIVHPLEGENGAEGEEFGFEAQVYDEQDSPETLDVTLASDLAGMFCEPTPEPSGRVLCDAALPAGRHLLTFTVWDTEGYSTESTRYFTVTSRSDIDDDGDGFTDTQGDCDDSDASVRPGATEYWNSRDDDCDGITDEGTEGWDDDGDGFSEAEDDCDDANEDVYPGATEIYNSRDEDCDGITDEGTEGWDDDGDGWTEVAGDCDDTYAASFPGAAELVDSRDNDCDGLVDEGTAAYDDDGDGFSETAGDCDDSRSDVRPGVSESCNSRDDDCDGSIDEAGASGCSLFYADVDGDGFGAGTGSCQCSASSSYSSALNTDCWDYNNQAFPGQSLYFTTDRGDGSYDFSCDGASSTLYTATYSCISSWYCFACDTYTEGFSGSVPACGANGTWKTGCTASWCSCSATGTTTLTQACR